MELEVTYDDEPTHRDISRSQALSHIEESMPEHSGMALARFTAANPHWHGAHWADVLDVLNDSDSNLDVVEPVIERLWPKLSETQRQYVGLIVLTLLWGSETFTGPRDETVLAFLAYLGVL